jgi:protein phosphatase
VPSEAPAPTCEALDAALVSVCGPVREVNEDAAVVVTGEAGQVIAVLADGMGGHVAGREAAEIVVRTCSERLSKRAGDGWQEALAAAITAANSAVLAAARAGAHDGMGATGVLALVEEPRTAPTLHLAHVGDSRAYLLRGRSLLRLTVDHSLVGQLVHDGFLDERQAAQHPDRHLLQRAIGQQAPLVAEVQPPIALGGGDRVLLMSDGLHGALADDDIQRIALACRSAAAVCEALLAAALAAASDDNVSVVCLWVPVTTAERRRTRPVTAARARR